MEEIPAAIKALMQDGDHIVLGLDANEDVCSSAVQKELANIEMFEAIICHHPTKSVPGTCNTNESRKPIDGIWISPGVEILRCGCLPFDSYDGFSSDHRMVWVEIDNVSILGHYPHYYPHYSSMPSADKVRSNDPRLRDRYNQRVLEAFEDEDIQLQVETLSLLMVRFHAGEDVSALVEELHGDLKEKTIRIQEKVGSKLRIFHTGPIPWSPRLQVFRDAIEYRDRYIRIQLGVLASRQAIKHLAKKIGEYAGIYSSLSVCINRLKLAHKAYKEAKKDATKWRTGFQETFVTAKAKERGLSEEVVINK